MKIIMIKNNIIHVCINITNLIKIIIYIYIYCIYEHYFLKIYKF